MSFIEADKINGFEQIIESLKASCIHQKWIEHLWIVIGLVNQYNPLSEVGNERFKLICYTILDKLIWEEKWFRPWYEASFYLNNEEKKHPPKNRAEMFDYLEKYWNKTDGFGGPERSYLIFLISYKYSRYKEYFED